MKKNLKQGMSGVLVVLILAVLGYVAYTILKNKNTQEEATPVLEEQVEEQSSTSSTQRVAPKAQSPSSPTTDSAQAPETQDIASIEKEISDVELEINNLLFEDLGME